MTVRFNECVQFGVLILALTGCEQASIPADNSGTIALLGDRLEILNDKVRAIEEQRLRDSRFAAILKPNTTGYTMLGTDETLLPVQLVRVEPSGNGTKAVLLIGNPLNVTITDLSAFLAWGETNAKGVEQDPVAELNRYTFKGTFAPGAWTEKTVPLADLPPARLGYVKLSGAIIGSMSLLRPSAPDTPQSEKE